MDRGVRRAALNRAHTPPEQPPPSTACPSFAARAWPNRLLASEADGHEITGLARRRRVQAGQGKAASVSVADGKEASPHLAQ
eukprot:2093936-Prymnesium_polylepis.1